MNICILRQDKLRAWWINSVQPTSLGLSAALHMWKQNAAAVWGMPEKLTTVRTAGCTHESDVPRHAPGQAKDWEYKGRCNFSISSTVWKAMCGKPNQTPNQTPNPATFVLWSVQESRGVSVAESEEAVAGTGTMGGLWTRGKKHSCVNCSTVMVLQLSWLSLP